MTRERRRPDPTSATIRLVIVCGVLILALVSILGSLVLLVLGKTPPDWLGLMIAALPTGLLGHLNQDGRTQSSGPASPGSMAPLTDTKEATL